MVGVPKRVRGCESCKKRRLTCDFSRPQCARCKEDDRECRFPGTFTFVVNDPGSHKSVYRKPRKGAAKAPTSPVDETLLARKTATPSDSTVVDPESRATSLAQSTPRYASLAFTMPQRVSNISHMQQQLLSHAVNLFKSDRPTDIALIQIWIPTLQHFAATSTPLKASPLACCAAWLARSDSNPALIDFSRHLYSEGLREVRNALRAPDAILEDETLGACLALAVFEVIECPDKCRAAYEWHRRACVRLVQMRGAKAHRDRVGHELFLAIRLHGIFYGFEQRRPNFLSTREWLTVPWEVHPKDDLHALADILARGPALLQKADTLALKPLSQSLPTLLTILSRLLDIDEELAHFLQTLQIQHPGPLYWESPTGPPNLHFPSPKLAALITLLWSLETMVWSSLEGIHAGLAQTHSLPYLPPSPRTERFTALAPQAHWQHAVRRIVRSVAYCLETTKSTAPPGIGVALEIVIDVLRGKGEGAGGCVLELREAERAREEMGRRWVAILLN